MSKDGFYGSCLSLKFAVARFLGRLLGQDVLLGFEPVVDIDEYCQEQLC